MKFNKIAFRSDAGVFINNDIYIFSVGILKVAEFNYIRNTDHYFEVPIGGENVTSINADSVFCDIRIQLIQGIDTMNIFIKDILYESKVPIDYVIHYIPHSKGDYALNLKQPDSNKSYKHFYNQSKYPCTVCMEKAWDITPKDWSEMKLK